MSGAACNMMDAIGSSHSISLPDDDQEEEDEEEVEFSLGGPMQLHGPEEDEDDPDDGERGRAVEMSPERKQRA